MIPSETMRGRCGTVLLLALLCSLVAVLVVVGCHMHLPGEQPGVVPHCSLCDLACVFVAIVAVLLAMLRFRAAPIACVERRRAYRINRTSAFFIRPPPVLFAA